MTLDASLKATWSAFSCYGQLGTIVLQIPFFYCWVNGLLDSLVRYDSMERQMLLDNDLHSISEYTAGVKKYHV